MDEEAEKRGPTFAVALSYEQNVDAAPVVVAKGAGLVADHICKIARENGVPLQTQPTLAKLLMTQEVGTAIPPELYQTVAEVLAFVYRLDKRTGQAHRKNG